LITFVDRQKMKHGPIREGFMSVEQIWSEAPGLAKAVVQGDDSKFYVIDIASAVYGSRPGKVKFTDIMKFNTEESALMAALLESHK
jgi:hypothetical protein